MTSYPLLAASKTRQPAKGKLKQTAIFPGRFDSLEKISTLVIQAATKAGFDEMAVYSIQTAVDEACSNIIDHAYGGESNRPIECTCEDNADSFKVVLRDFGKSFQPDSVPNPDLESDLEERKERGLGLYFMRQLMDDVEFKFSPKHGNILTMIKWKAKKH